MRSGNLLIDASYWEPPDYPEEEAYIARCEANRRHQCEVCFAFVSDDAANRQVYGRWTLDDAGVTCEPGKGCKRKAATDA